MLRDLKQLSFLILLVNLITSCEQKTNSVSENSIDKYKLVWSDEFNEDGKPNPEKWDYEIGFIRNHEKQYYTNRSQNVRVKNGYLIIEARKEKIANKDYGSDAFADKPWLDYIPKIDSAKYTSASLTTRNKADWKYGRFDIRAKLPKGVGQWPAIWMLGLNKPDVGWPACGEIDIMEHVGFRSDSIYGSIHSKAFNHIKKTQKTHATFISGPYENFHVFSVIWTPEKIDFLLDNTVYFSILNTYSTSDEWPFNQAFYLRLNNAVGGDWGGVKGIDDSVFPQQFVVDYVRVFQKK